MASPDTYECHVVMTFHALDAGCEQTDPVNQAFALPIVRWFTAIWKRWVGLDTLGVVCEAAQSKPTAMRDNLWSGVRFPRSLLLPPYGSLAGKCNRPHAYRMMSACVGTCGVNQSRR